MNNELDQIIRTLKDFDEINNVLININQNLINIGTSCQELGKNLEQINSVGFNEFLEAGGNISAIIGTVELLGEKILSTSIASDVATTSVVMLSGAMKFLAANPFLAVIGGLLALGTAIVAFNYEESDAIKQTREFATALDEKRKSMEETEETVKKSIQSSIDSAKGAEAQSAALRTFVENLKGLADENGYIRNFEEAQYYIDKINTSMPGTVKLTDEGKLAWMMNSTAIEDNIAKLEKKAKVEAYYDGFVESLKNEAKLRADLASAQLNYNNELEKQRVCKEQIAALEEKQLKSGLSDPEKELLNEKYLQFERSKLQLEDYAGILESTTNSYANNKKGQELWREALTASDDKIIASAILMSDEYTTIEEKGTSTWANLAGASEDCKNRMATARGEELATMQLTSGALEAAMVHKALVHGLSYDEMISKLKDAGVQMTAEEEKRLQKSYEAWKMSSDDIQKVQSTGLDLLKLMKISALSEMTSSDQKMLSENVVKFANSGKEQGLQLCQKLSENLAQSNGKIDDETRKIIEIINNIDDVDPEVIAKIIKPSDSEVQSVTDQFAKIPKNVYTNWGIKGITSEITYKFNPKYQLAEGGFPPTGELFVAREAGPELVGRINGKTAVANNDQIVSGISSGVFNAVRSAMAGNGGNGNMNIHATFVMDGDVVGKQVIKYHNGVVKRTGTTPLMI